jgi:hypothetical protein
MSPLRLLCLFSSAEARDASFFGAHAPAGLWHSDLEQGRCEFVSLVLDHQAPGLADQGGFGAATVLCRQADLGPPLLAPLQQSAERFAQAGRPFELVAESSPVSLMAWIARHAPALLEQCRADGEVRPESPSWWRERARLHLARSVASTPIAVEDLAEDLARFRRQRGW